MIYVTIRFTLVAVQSTDCRGVLLRVTLGCCIKKTQPCGSLKNKGICFSQNSLNVTTSGPQGKSIDHGNSQAQILSKLLLCHQLAPCHSLQGQSQIVRYPASSKQKKRMRVQRRQAQMSQAPDSETARVTSANIPLMRTLSHTHS